MTKRAPGTTIGRYVIRSVLGTGGMSTVYACHDTLLDREVAIKVFAARAVDQDLIRTQEAEARLAAKLNHHALTTLFDAGVETTVPGEPQIYLVMERVEGADLKNRLAEGPLGAMDAAYLGTDLSGALAYIHQNGFLHCDIKPANVLLVARNEDLRMRGKLTDFGISGIIGAHSGRGTTTGTAAYLAPEQVEGAAPSPATDVYALGLVLIEALSGRLEFPGSVHETAAQRLSRDPVVPPSAPEDLAAILRDMTHRDPLARPTARKAGERFERVAARLIAQLRGEAPLPVTRPEDQRLEAVHRYGVLDTPPDEAFDRISRLATRLLDTPISFVSIVDEKRVFHKARLGVDVDEVDREDSLCPITVDLGKPWSVADIAVDDRTKDNALLAAHGVRAYAAAPLTTSDGYNIGSLCVYDVRPRTFDRDDLSNLAELAAVAMHELELRLAARRAAFLPTERFDQG